MANTLRIACVAQEVGADVQDCCFEYKNVKWQVCQGLREDFPAIRELIDWSASRTEPFLTFEVLLKRDVQTLHAFITFQYPWYGNAWDEETKKVAAKLLPALFRNYKEYRLYPRHIVEDDDADESQTLVKTYVTKQLYEKLYAKHQLNPLPETQLTLPACFRTNLCEYQKKTVRWLLKRERQQDIFDDPFFYRLESKSGGPAENPLYKHIFAMELRNEQPDTVTLPPGGILADEMGLGKTVETMALLLLHPRPAVQPPAFLRDYTSEEGKKARMDLLCICTSSDDYDDLVQCSHCGLMQHVHCMRQDDKEHTAEVNEPYFCPQCWDLLLTSHDTLVETAATIIVTPNSIRTQWRRELQHHIKPNLKVLMYDGISTSWISPLQMADYDVVLTDYNVLRREVYHTNRNVPDRHSRHKQKFLRTYTPLLMLRWWRVCLDEAQMVESNTSKVSDLVRLLPAINRWAISGTPIQKSIDDLQSLLNFIGFHAVSRSNEMWKNLTHDFIMRQDCEGEQESWPLIDILQKCMTRTCKSKVLEELPIPPQTEETHRIDLSNVETLFYMEQHQECRETFFQTIDKYLESSQKIRTISPAILKGILAPLLKMRQCCTISVVHNASNASSGFGNAQPKKLYMHPQELNSHLRTTNEIACISELRTICSSHNGLAGMHYLNGLRHQAIKSYKEVLKLADKYKDMNLRVDSLLQIHALYNLLEVAEAVPGADSRYLTQQETYDYIQKLCAMEWRYLEPYTVDLATARSAALQFKEEFLEAHRKDDCDILQLTAELVETVNESGDCELRGDLLGKIIETFQFSQLRKKAQELHSLNAVLFVLTTWHDNFMQLQEKIFRQFKDMEFFAGNVSKDVPADKWELMRKFITVTADCHLVAVRENAPKSSTKASRKPQKQTLCQLCKTKENLQQLECLIFAKQLDKITNQAEGATTPSMEMTLFKIILTFLRPKKEFARFSQQIQRQLKVMEDLQQLCQKMSKYWIEIDYMVKAYDELDMCKMRMTTTDEADATSLHQIETHAIEYTCHQMMDNLDAAIEAFDKKYCRLRFLTHLETRKDEDNICPICRTQITETYTVLECGHPLCARCLRDLRKHCNMNGSIACVVCRNTQNAKNVYFAVSAPSDSEQNIQLAEKYSSKITYIARLVIRLKQAHADDENPLKILMFSQWLEILNAIAMALQKEGITHRVQKSLKAVDEFKDPRLDITCLLMPLAKGSKGLNLIEATHVFLVEPILSPAEELQAIGRVHRFGQTRPTTVHRFIVNNTIEENISNLVAKGKAAQEHWEYENISVEDLKNLFELRTT